MAALDIVSLIEKNPITTLSDNYNNKLLIKIKETFTNFEQQLFIGSFYLYLKCDEDNDFIINMDNLWEWLGFSQKVNCKKVLEKYFTQDKDYKILLCKLQEQKVSLDANIKKKSGGHNRENIMLNVKTFKSLCLKAQTKKADEIHDYYLKMEKILHNTLQEESNELKEQLQLKDTENMVLKEKTNDHSKELTKQRELEREKSLLETYGNSESLIYIIRIKTYETKEYIVKIGESRRGVMGRYKEHKSHYEECVLLDCYNVAKSKDFENFIHSHESIKDSRVTDLKGHESERELFLIGRKISYATLTKLVKSNIETYNKINYSEVIEKLQAQLECAILKNVQFENERINNSASQSNLNETAIANMMQKINSLVTVNNILINKVESLEAYINIHNKKDNSTVNTPSCSTANAVSFVNTIGPRLQKINPETLTLLKVYESVSELMNEDFKMKRPSINKAVQEHTVYNGFRWNFVSRDQDASVIHELSPTKHTILKHSDYVAKLNDDKTEILAVYLDRKTAAKLNGYESSSALDIPVRNAKISRGFYYSTYRDVPDDLRDVFNAKLNIKEILLYKNGIGVFDKDKKVIGEFACKYDVIKGLNISDKTLAKYLNGDSMYNEMFFREVGEKVWV